jgi:hypothetical protein
MLIQLHYFYNLQNKVLAFKLFQLEHWLFLSDEKKIKMKYIFVTYLVILHSYLNCKIIWHYELISFNRIKIMFLLVFLTSILLLLLLHFHFLLHLYMLICIHLVLKTHLINLHLLLVLLHHLLLLSIHFLYGFLLHSFFIILSLISWLLLIHVFKVLLTIFILILI